MVKISSFLQSVFLQVMQREHMFPDPIFFNWNTSTQGEVQYHNQYKPHSGVWYQEHAINFCV